MSVFRQSVSCSRMSIIVNLLSIVEQLEFVFHCDVLLMSDCSSPPRNFTECTCFEFVFLICILPKIFLFPSVDWCKYYIQTCKVSEYLVNVWQNSIFWPFRINHFVFTVKENSQYSCVVVKIFCEIQYHNRRITSLQLRPLLNPICFLSLC